MQWRTGSSDPRDSPSSTARSRSRPAPGEPFAEVADPELLPQDSRDHPLAEWFGNLRMQLAKERGERRAARGGRPPARRSRALITMVHNEPVFLPIWLRYYGRFFGPDDIYVLDNQTTDGSTSRDGFVRIPAEHETVDHRWMVDTIQDLQHELIGRYDLVVVTDVDEIIAPVPELGDLGGYLDHFDDEFVNCLGYELLHMKDREGPLDLNRPILGQRRFWFPNDAYSKPAVATAPMEWRPGFHQRRDERVRFDPDLWLIHLHRMDYELCAERHRVRRRKNWADEDEQHSWAVHNRLAEGPEFESWFYNDSGFEEKPPRPEEMRRNWWGTF